jgi:hypothetical protein
MAKVFITILAFTFRLLANAAQPDSVRTVAELLPDSVTEKVQLKFHLPADFVVRDADDASKGLDGAGLLWASPKTIEQAKQTKKLSHLPGPLFLVKISDNVAQTFKKFTVEANLKEALPLRELTTKKLTWGKHPVLSFKGIREDGTVATGAWLGLNTQEGWTVFIDFRGRTQDNKLLPEDQQIWDDLLSRTEAVR